MAATKTANTKRGAKVVTGTTPKTPAAPHELATVKEACDYLKIGKTKFYRMKNAGQLATVVVGYSIRIAWSVLYEIAKNGAAAPKTAS